MIVPDIASSPFESSGKFKLQAADIPRCFLFFYHADYPMSKKQFKVKNAKCKMITEYASVHSALYTLHFALLLKIPSNPVR